MKNDDWKDRLKKWKSQARNLDQSGRNLKSKINDSGNTSVLACLLTPISVKKIQQRVETHFLKASRRTAGLLMLAQVIDLDLLPEVVLDLQNWFASALRDRINQMSHYLDNIKSCGNHLEESLRTNFFKILEAILNQIKRSRDKQVVIRLLDGLNWKFMGRDHQSIHAIGIFNTLREGDGSRKHPIRQVWGKRTGVITWDEKEEPGCLQYVLLDTFEKLFTNLVSRIVDSDLGTQMQLKKTGTAIPMLERSKSIISTNISESLIGDSFHILFKELNRYFIQFRSFRGINYQAFVTAYNKLKVANLKNSSDDQLGAEFIDELLFDMDQEEKDYQKEKDEKKKLQETNEETKEEPKKEPLESNVDEITVEIAKDEQPKPDETTTDKNEETEAVAAEEKDDDEKKNDAT